MSETQLLSTEQALVDKLFERFASVGEAFLYLDARKDGVIDAGKWTRPFNSGEVSFMLVLENPIGQRNHLF